VLDHDFAMIGFRSFAERKRRDFFQELSGERYKVPLPMRLLDGSWFKWATRFSIPGHSETGLLRLVDLWSRQDSQSRGHCLGLELTPGRESSARRVSILLASARQPRKYTGFLSMHRWRPRSKCFVFSETDHRLGYRRCGWTELPANAIARCCLDN